MSNATPAVEHKARKPHRCDWCGEGIVAGDTYSRWRYYGDAVATVRAHPECLSAGQEAAHEWGSDEVYFNRSNPRGCDCGYSAGCPTCEERKRLTGLRGA